VINDFNRLEAITISNILLLDYTNSFRKILPLYSDKKGGESMSEVKLKDLLKKENIKIHVKADNWEGAVRIGGEILVQNGYVEERFVEAVVQTIKTIGPYMVIYPGLAVPHARPEYGVKKLGMSLITLDEPINFGSQYNDPVKTIICLAPIDTTSHLKVLELVLKMIHDGSLRGIENAEDIDEIMKRIH